MKRMKQWTSILLVLAMFFTIAMPAMAVSSTDATGTITVDNPIEGQAYTAYKIFDVTYTGDKYAYSIDGDSEWLSVVQEYARNAENGLTLEKAAGKNAYMVTVSSDEFSAPKFAKALKAAVEGKTGTDLTETGTVAEATGLELGYYFVTSMTGALCNLTTTNPTAEIHDKNDVPFEKEVTEKSANVGDTVHYTITGKVPDTTGFSSYTYKITDIMSEGLTFNTESVEITVDGTRLTEKYTLNTEAGKNGFTLSINVKEMQNQVGKQIKVTYTATLNDKAVANVSTNEATLEYSNDPTEDNETTSVNKVVKTHTAKIVINKYAYNATNESDMNTKLKDAKFVLKAKNGENSGKYYKYDEGTKKVTWEDDQDNATRLVTDENGAAKTSGLADGDYELIEIESPEGYNLLEEPVSVKIAGNNDEVDTLTVTANVANNTGAELPSTGGIGTTIFYLIGGALMLGTGVVLVTRKRMSLEK